MIDERTTRLAQALIAAAALFPAAARAQETPSEDVPAAALGDSDLDDAIVVVATRYATPIDRITAAVTTLGEEDIERRQATHVDEMLREIPGVQVVRDGPTGQFSRLFVRGAASNQTLVLVDGIPQNDETTGGGFDFNDLSTAAVERIEVLRGSYSVLYGSEAIGGVVSVTTKRGRDQPGGFVRFEGGSFDTHREAAGVNGVADDLDFALSASNHQTHGERSRERYRGSDVTSRLGYQLDEDVRLDWTGRYVDSVTQSPFDFATSGVLPEDGNIERRRHTYSTGLALVWDVDPSLTVRAHTSYLALRSKYRNGPDGVETVDPDFVPDSGDEEQVVRDELRSNNDEDDVRGRLDGTWRMGETLGWAAPEDGGFAFVVTAGGEWLRQETESRTTFPDFGAITSSTQKLDDTTRTHSLFTQADLLLPDAGPLTAGLITAGVRHDDHSEAGDETSPYVGGRVAIAPTDTTLRASYGEGFRAPSPSELLDPFVGNSNLSAETSRSRDVGIEQRFADGRAVLGVTWFELEVDDLIAYDADFTSPDRPFGALRNFGRTRTRGTEWSGAADIGHGFSVRGSYTRQDPEDRDSGMDLPNRTRWFGSLGVTWSDGPFQVSLDGYVSRKLHQQGGRYTYPEPSERRRPGKMKLVNLTARWRASETVSLFARVDNLLDDDYVATPAAPAGPPLGVFVGAQWDF